MTEANELETPEDQGSLSSNCSALPRYEPLSDGGFAAMELDNDGEWVRHDEAMARIAAVEVNGVGAESSQAPELKRQRDELLEAMTQINGLLNKFGRNHEEDACFSIAQRSLANIEGETNQ